MTTDVEDTTVTMCRVCAMTKSEKGGWSNYYKRQVVCVKLPKAKASKHGTLDVDLGNGMGWDGVTV